MFLKSNNIDCDIQSVLELSWGKRNEFSGVRPYAALSYRLKGDSEFIHKNEVLHAVSGDIVFVPAYYSYRQNTNSSEHLICVHFSSQSPLPEKICKLSVSNPDYFARKFNELYCSQIRKQPGYEYECKSIFYKILMKAEQEYAEMKFTSVTDKIDEALEYIHENYNRTNITVSELAKMCCMSDTYFRKLFYKRFSETPLKYINKLKLSYAIALLDSGYYTVSECSDRCCFENVYYFSNFIKKHTGKSPSEHIPNNVI